MLTYLLKYGVCGIKNIKETVELSFYKKGIDKNFDPSDYRIKSIYGENGSGKTAIVTSFSIFKKLIMFADYLSDPKTQDLLNHIVNKEKNEFRIYSEFYMKSKNTPYVFFYEILVGKDEDNELFEIKQESLKFKRATYAKAVYRDCFVVEDGRFINLLANENAEETIVNKTMNLLKKSSAISKLMDLIANQPFDEALGRLTLSVLLIQMTALSMRAVLNEEDEHALFYAKKTIARLSNVEEIGDMPDNETSSTLRQMAEIIEFQSNRIQKSDIASYEKRIKRLTAFVQKFKPELERIDVEKKDIDAKYYEISLIFDYGSYCVDYEFESTGIKKLVRIFDAILAVARGGIVFIDEFDANINSVFFDKLIEYVRDYAGGQLCFTAHNTSSMDSLKDGKDSINFLTNDNQIVKWTKNGHYSPDILYRNGMIEDMPFNIYGSDFVGIFEDDYE